MTTDMERRRKQFISGEQRCQGHSEGNLLFLLKKYSPFKAKHDNSKYEYHFQKVGTTDEAKKKETKLIKDYVKQYGEVPPLNSAIPDRYEEKSWENKKRRRRKIRSSKRNKALGWKRKPRKKRRK